MPSWYGRFGYRPLARVAVALGASMLLLVPEPGIVPPVQAATVTAAIIEPSDDPDSWAYDPPTLTVSVGDIVTWRNNGQDVHTATSDDGSFDSDDIKPGGAWSRTFTTPGTYTYYCLPHTWMTATIVVTG
jgi:plastocyanin